VVSLLPAKRGVGFPESIERLCYCCNCLSRRSNQLKIPKVQLAFALIRSRNLSLMSNLRGEFFSYTVNLKTTFSPKEVSITY
jgi:hypothetical protein